MNRQVLGHGSSGRFDICDTGPETLQCLLQMHLSGKKIALCSLRQFSSQLCKYVKRRVDGPWEC
jgi:hypothetical protein